ncbi:hypothetical protein [Noviherbaspirillum denitrificans]|uniref:Uncharacterized protein n=1 Tax=Noviherbaspirillum denitrificans TaxID=1968433 RepID=A0A254TGB1_9BURK|nr:hypothetical protein [Noviherbaspirillum denitrificans]OWW21696.1 hypothetical protein AYR66_21600 [Noviherbaspirillum denitrificans]
MFVGHYSAAFLAKRVAPAVPLPVYFVTCQLIDLFWGGFVLLGVEKMRVIPDFTRSNGLDLYFMPYTHSLSSALLWSIGTAILFWLCTPRLAQRTRCAIAIGLTVAAHWMLDLLVHIPDLPLWFDSMKVGLGWWNYWTFALLLELALMWGSVLLCLGTVAENRHRYLLLAVAMTGLHLYSLFKQPAEPSAVAMQLLGAYLALTVGAWWASRPVSAGKAIAA